ncbi:DNA-directed RNA polymerase III subunit RPC5-like [Mytilus trossulus]|uniref:DNA-directed RNA polymerase III subunit RPC5-like n=1 Tax=Mytilus trossulus TaxID=6551 RepID=UPI003004084D
MSDEEDDPIEHEIDVYLSKSLSDNLFLLQYPIRPAHLNYDKIEHLAARVKPQQKKVEFDLAVNTSSNYYAKSKGEQIALNVDGPSRGDQGGFYRSDKMDKQILTSAPCSGDIGRYGVGVFKDGELHLSPLHAVVQMRPSFNYLDKADDKIKTEAAAREAEGDMSQDEEDEAKPVTMKFARQETEEAKARRMRSYGYLQKKRNEESWIHVEYHGVNSDLAETERSQLHASKEEEVSEFCVKPDEYLKMLMPPSSETESEKPAMPSNVLSLIQLRTMPLADQVKTLLTNAKVITFSQLITLLPQGTDPGAALRSLHQVAVLVQGCWVVKSEILYPKEACSPHSGVSGEHLSKGRDYVMWRFTQSRVVTRKDIASVVKLPAEDVKDILEQMSRIRANCGWEFLFQYDHDFVSRNPEIVHRQKAFWDSKYQILCKQLKIPKEHEKKFKDKDLGMPGLDKPTRRRRNSSKGSPRRKRTLSGRSVSDHSDIEPDIKMDSETSADDDIPTHHEPMEVAEVNHVTNGSNIPSSTNCDKTISKPVSNKFDEKRTELLNFVCEKLQSRFILGINELRRLLNIRLTQCSSGYILNCEISDQMLEEALDESGSLKLENMWPPGTPEESLYALTFTGDKLDPVRKVLLSMFTISYKTTRKNFIKKVKEETDIDLSENDAKLLLSDYCVNKGKGVTWYLKGTLIPDS